MSKYRLIVLYILRSNTIKELEDTLHDDSYLSTLNDGFRELLIEDIKMVIMEKEMEQITA